MKDASYDAPERSLREDVQPVVEGWAMDLYCKYTVDPYKYGAAHDMDTWGVSIGGTTRKAAREEARALGWVLHRDGSATCPHCAKALGLR